VLAALIAGGLAGCGGRDGTAATPRAAPALLQSMEAAQNADWSATITAMLREARRAGSAPRVVCRTHGITAATCYRRRATRGAVRGAMRPVEVRRLERLGDETGWTIVVGPALDLAMLKDMTERNP